MSDTGHLKCPRCGKELTAAAPEGLCPSCLGALNFATDTALPEADAKETLPPLTPAELAPHFPQLEILECLGRGGMGVVYKARQKSLNRFVALKLLAPERVQDVKFAERFAREAHALAALNHPSIVTVHDFGQAGGYYFLLMEFVDGVNLRQLLRSRKLQPSEALAIVPPICEALQYAHEHGIVHRDIKPENLLLAKDGRVKIADFGIAKMLGTDGTLSSLPLSSPSGGEGQREEGSATQHTTMGTPQYMAPEQRDHSQSADHRADIYSLGVVLYELLTGELPADKLQPPSRVRGVQIDVRLDEIVLRALEKTPALRYQTAGEFKTQVETIGAQAASSSAKVQLKAGRAYLTNREKLGTAEGQLYLYRDKCEVILDESQLAFVEKGKTTLIPLASIRDVSQGRFPLSVNPAGLNFISFIYDDQGTQRELIFAPSESLIAAPSAFNAHVDEWLQSLRTAIQTVTGRAPASRPVSELTLASSPKSFATRIALLPLLIVIGIGFFWGAVQLSGQEPDLPKPWMWLLPLGLLFMHWQRGKLEMAAGSHPSKEDGRSGSRVSGALRSLNLAMFSGAVVFFLTVFISVIAIGMMPWRFGRESAYLLTFAVSIALGLRTYVTTITELKHSIAGNELMARQLTSKCKILSIVAMVLLVPIFGFGFFILMGMASESGSWNPAGSEKVFVALSLMGMMFLPHAARGLWLAGKAPVDRAFLTQKENLRKSLFALISLFLLMALGVLMIKRLSDQRKAARLHAELQEQKVEVIKPVSVRKLLNPPFIAHLPFGGSVELLAVRLLNTPTNAPWWKPDGTPSSYGGDITMEGMPKSDGGVLGLLKVTWPKTSTNTTGFSMDAGRFALKNGLRQPIEELRIEHFDRAIAINDTTILSLETGVREWQTVMSFKPGLADYIFGGKRRRQWEISETTAGNLKVACNKLFRLPGNEYSLAVIDKKGNRWTPSSFRITTTTGQLEGEYEASFDGIGNENTGRVTLQDVEEIRWQMRPYDSIQFQNVSLQPGKHTQVSINEFVSETTLSSLTAKSVVPSGGRLEFNISNAEVTKQKPLFLALEKNAKYYAPIPVYFSAAGVVEQTRSATDWLTTNDIDLVSWSAPGMASLAGINLQGSAGVDKLIFDDLQNNPQSDYWSILSWDKNFVYQQRTDREHGPAYWVLRTAKRKIIMLEVSSSEVNGGQLSIRYRSGTQPVSKENKTQSSNPPQPVVSSMSNAVPVWPLILPFLFLGLGIGGLVLIIWLSRKKGLKGCLLAGAIMLGVIAGVVVLVALVSYSSRAKAFRVTSQPVTRFELESINQQPVPSEPNGLAIQVQNGLNVRVPGGQLATFEFYMRQADDTLELVPALTAVIATSPSGGFNGSVYWQGKRGDEARGTNQLWFWSVNGHTLGGQPLPSRPDYETNVTYRLRRDEVLNWWQLNLPNLTTMSLGETRDIPIFRTFGTATVHSDQPKEAIVRVKCEALPADFKIDAGQYQLLFGTKHNQPAGTDAAEVNPAALPRSLVPQSVVDEARAEAKRAAALFDAARTTRTEVIAAEYHLKWAEAMFNGDVRGALQAKRDEAALKLESIDSLMKTGRMSNADRAKAVRELTEAEAALKQWDLKAAK